MTIEEHLIAARALIAQPYGWTRGAYSKSHSRSPDGRCYCAVGALYAYAEQERLLAGTTARIEYLLDEAARQAHPGCSGVLAYNDDVAKSKHDVLRIYDAAIEAVS